MIGTKYSAIEFQAKPRREYQQFDTGGEIEIRRVAVSRSIRTNTYMCGSRVIRPPRGVDKRPACR
jgi:hypothetical protein